MIIGVIRQQTGSYTWGLYSVAGLLAFSALVVLILSARANKSQTAELPSSSYSLTGEVTMRTYKIAAIPADGIGPEVISAGVEVLHALTRHNPQLNFDVETFDWGSDYYQKTWRDDAGRGA